MDAAFTFLLEQVTGALRWYKDLISGAENEFNQLKNDLGSLRAILRDADNRSNKAATFKNMEKEIREVVYVVEDTIDTCLTNKAAAKKSKNPASRLMSTVNLAKEVQSLREEKVKPMLEKLGVYLTGLGGPAQAAAAPAEQPPSPSKRDQSIRRDKVVGFEDEEETLTGYLMAETKELDVISIIGMPGLGKTTLACKIFENEDIRYQFPIRIWVQVSQRFNSREVFLEILKYFNSNDMSGLSNFDLVNSVRSCLEKQKFLLVMDDVWSPEDWTVINNALPANNALGKVMITSRLKSVGMQAKVSREPHMLRFFSLDESWKLLQLEVYGNDKFPQELIIIGKEIAEQCYGVPLTVVVVGGILVDLFVKTRAPLSLKKEWEKVKENVSEFVQNDKEKRITDVVKLSYNRLPDYLRECFLYMAVFPEEHVIPAWMLTRLWAAEGFVLPRVGKSLEEAAEENLYDLASRNLLMLDDINPMGKIKTCRVHDMIRQFCRLKALEQNLFQEIKKNKQGVLAPPVAELPKFHRLCVHSDLTEFCERKPKGPRIRSFLCFNKEPVNLDAKYTSTIPDAFKLLRVLESISIKFGQFPTKVNQLNHLRYITLHIDNLAILPKPLAKLWNLQTLIVETKSRTITMKANVWKMYRLRHLKMKAAIVLDDKWSGEGGENLQTLNRLAPKSCTAKVSERACNLKELGIRGELATLFRNMSMKKLHRLEKLKLMNEVPFGSEHQPLNLPQPECFPPKLMRLTLSSTSLEWKDMSTLAMIVTLEVLKLKEKAFIGKTWNSCPDVFQNLQFLVIINADLETWEASGDTFPSLRCIVLKNCENLKHIPDSLDENLEMLDIERLCKSAVESARKIESRKHEEQKQEPKLGARFRLKVGPGCGNNPIDQV